MTDLPSNSGPSTRGSLAREVALLLAVGLALGVAHNAFMLASGPGKGLAWVKAERRLVRLEDVVPEPPVTRELVHAETAPAAPVPLASPTTRQDSAARPTPGPRTPPPPATPSADPKPAAVAEPARSQQGDTGAPALVATPAPDVPAIPESREPIEAELATVRRLHAANAAVFVDARSAAEYAEGHIAGAVNIPFDEVFRDPKRLDGFADRGQPVVTYCGGGDCDLSRNLAFSLIDAGRRRVLVFHGGLPEWQGAGLPVNQGGQP